MALNQEQAIALQKQQKGVLEINARDYYYNKLRPALVNFNTNYHTDRELNRTIVEVMNKADSYIVRDQYNLLEESYEGLLGTIQQPSYLIRTGARFAPEDEKKAITNLISMFNDLSMILKYENEPQLEEHEIKERINYHPSNDGRMGYNLDDLSNRGPKQNRERIPNPVNPKPKYAY